MIEEFKGEYAFLSNFHPSPIEWGWRTYATVEHFYQACKTTDQRLHDMIRCQTTPGRAKRAGRGIELRHDWEEIKNNVMLVAVRKKFEIVNLRKLLIATGNQQLQEGNSHGDKIWGCVREGGRWVGENQLGKILMQVREEIIRGSMDDSMENSILDCLTFAKSDADLI